MADDAPTNDAPENGSGDEHSEPSKTDDGLGDAGKRALDEERRARREADKALRAAQAELEKLRPVQSEYERLREATMSETERAIAKAREEARAELAAAHAQERVRDKVALAAAGKLADPDDAIFLLGDLNAFVTKNGDVDTKAIGSAIDTLVKAKPYLAPVAAKAGPLPGGGATPSNGFSMDDYIRTAARRH